MRTKEEIKKEIKSYEQDLKDPDLDFKSQTWIELQIQELEKELRELKSKL